MKKIDLEATLADIRRAAETSAAMPGQDAAELACNRDGVGALIEFSRWSFTQRYKLEPGDYVAATGMLIGQFVVGSLSCINDEDKGTALQDIVNTMASMLVNEMHGTSPDGSVVVQATVREVGDA